MLSDIVLIEYPYSSSLFKSMYLSPAVTAVSIVSAGLPSSLLSLEKITKFSGDVMYMYDVEVFTCEKPFRSS